MDNPFKKLTAEKLVGLAGQTQSADAEGISKRRIDHSDPDTPPNLVGPAPLPTPDDLRRKAQQCRTEAEGRTIPELRTHLLEIAAEYERLAIRGEQFEGRSRLPNASPMNDIALARWFS